MTPSYALCERNYLFYLICCATYVGSIRLIAYLYALCDTYLYVLGENAISSST